MEKNMIEDGQCIQRIQIKCKLFCSKSSACIANQLINEGTRDWKNIGSKLKSHKTSYEHVTNMDKWIEL